VLSIGKLAAGQANYYLDQAEGRVDVATSVGEGAEEYYLGGTEARGAWLGSSSARLGLTGPVAAHDLRSVLAGLDPRDGSTLRSARGSVHVAAFDLTFSAPKSVSVVFGVGDHELSDAVRQAHERAVREAFEYLEQSAAFVRRGPAGVEVMQAEGLVAAGFRHRTSRVGDPQLHTHVLVANLGLGTDGRWSALDGRRIYAHARTASFVYQAVLRGELTHTLGVEWTPVKQGIAEIVDLDTDVLRAFSRRRAEIVAALGDRGTSSARAAEAAALATRRAKDRGISADALTEEWRVRAAALGLDVCASGTSPAIPTSRHSTTRPGSGRSTSSSDPKDSRRGDRRSHDERSSRRSASDFRWAPASTPACFTARPTSCSARVASWRCCPTS
jgi:conjugative relaxase-like TrwC/TraI family protein